MFGDNPIKHAIAIALASLALVACAPRAEQAKPTVTVHKGDRFGTLTQRNARGQEFSVKTTEAAGVHTPHVILDSGTVTATVSSADVVGTIAHDATATTADPVLIGGYSSAAAPTSVSADSEAVRAWYLRNGAAATVITAAGALVGGDATNGLDVDVTRVAVPSTFYYGTLNVDVSGTEEALGSAQALTAGCLVKSPAANTGIIYVGKNGVTTSTGYPLGDDQEVWITTDNIDDIYVDVATNNDDAAYVCY